MLLWRQYRRLRLSLLLRWPCWLLLLLLQPLLLLPLLQRARAVLLLEPSSLRILQLLLLSVGEHTHHVARAGRVAASLEELGANLATSVELTHTHARLLRRSGARSLLKKVGGRLRGAVGRGSDGGGRWRWCSGPGSEGRAA